MVKSHDLPIVTDLLREIDRIEEQARAACTYDAFQVRVSNEPYRCLSKVERHVLRRLVLGNMHSRIALAAARAAALGCEIEGYDNPHAWIEKHLALVPEKDEVSF